jgi:hypothetical protein
MVNDTNIRKIVGYGFLAYLGWSIFKKKDIRKGIEDAVIKPAEKIKDVGEDILKVSEKKAKMISKKLKAKSTKKPKTKSKTKSKKKDVTNKIKEEVKKVEKTEVKKSIKKKVSSVKAGKKGGEKTAEKGKHKGHSSKEGLAQDQKLVSKEEHEENYQKSKED